MSFCSIHCLNKHQIGQIIESETSISCRWLYRVVIYARTCDGRLMIGGLSVNFGVSRGGTSLDIFLNCRWSYMWG